MTPIERAARALHKLDPDRAWDWSAYNSAYHNRRLAEARAVIEGLREPGPEVIAAGCERVGSVQYVETVWWAMINAILDTAGEQENG